MARVAGLLLVVVLACSSESPPPRDNFWLLNDLANARATHPFVRMAAISDLVSYCCRPFAETPVPTAAEVELACREVEIALRVERHPEPRDALLYTSVSAACLRRFPAEEYWFGPCSETKPCTTELRHSYIWHLAKHPPSVEIAREALAQLQLSNRGAVLPSIPVARTMDELMNFDHGRIESAVQSVIAALHDDDLAPVIAVLRGCDPVARRIALIGIALGMSHVPFHNDELQAALEELARGPDEWLAEGGQREAARNRELRRLSPEAILAMHPNISSRELARRFGCGNEAVTKLLNERLRSEPLDGSIELDIELRAERCGRSSPR